MNLEYRRLKFEKTKYVLSVLSIVVKHYSCNNDPLPGNVQIFILDQNIRIQLYIVNKNIRPRIIC